MLTFSKIDDKFSIYKEKKVVIFGAGNSGKAVYNNLRNLNANIICFCDNDIKKQNNKIFGKEIISIKQLKKIYNEEIVIQIASIYNEEIEKQLIASNLSEYISYSEYIERKMGASLYFIGKNDLDFVINSHKDKIVRMENGSIINLTEHISEVAFFNKNSYCIHCMPQKTGDSTLISTTLKYTKDFSNLGHTFKLWSKIESKINKSKKIKFVTAARDVIAQNISCFFQHSYGYWSVYEFWKNGGDVQFMFDMWLKKFVGNDLKVFCDIKDIDCKVIISDIIKKEMKRTFPIQYFFQEQFEKYLGIDLFKYPFDKEKGYSIVKVGNIEIFIYQLERLNDIASHLGEFMELDEYILENANEASKKWYNRSYKRALKELKISREYFDECYSSEFMKHFYSDDDIEKFKKRWENNIYN